ncbi:MAG TPA: pyruvate dehydrogenase (acetyl-transferring) E1 component subunit alpha [Dermatophilaceae bacterium]|nr:pyruvate dehydrogenase (acetyl-transferring) E1 component subunit alpha [Dermatophilaceae bacterium]
MQLVTPEGTPVVDPRLPMPDTETLVRAHDLMVQGRRFNDQAHALVRQGRLAVYPSSHGQEACQVAAAMVLDDQDWLFPTYRDTVAAMVKGVDPVQILLLLAGDWHAGYDPYEHHCAPTATPLATQLVHAAGVGYAARVKGERTVVVAMCGDGATSEGDFHEALNFAAVFKAPVVFLIQNNEFAISVPLARQTAAPSLAAKAIGYGMPGKRVDGNDVAALLAVLGEAVERARAGEGPTLVEAHTYRMQAHTNADDATRYRTSDAVKEWEPRDPILRSSAHLRSLGALDDDHTTALTQRVEEMAAEMRLGMSAERELDPAMLFDHVYATPTPQLREQRAQLLDELAREEAAK